MTENAVAIVAGAAVVVFGAFVLGVVAVVTLGKRASMDGEAGQDGVRIKVGPGPSGTPAALRRKPRAAAARPSPTRHKPAALEVPVDPATPTPPSPTPPAP